MEVGSKVYLACCKSLKVREITVNDGCASREKILESRALGAKVFLSKSVAEACVLKVRDRQIARLEAELEKLKNTTVRFT